jgi:hypothetical protein
MNNWRSIMKKRIPIFLTLAITITTVLPNHTITASASTTGTADTQEYSTYEPAALSTDSLDLIPASPDSIQDIPATVTPTPDPLAAPAEPSPTMDPADPSLTPSPTTTPTPSPEPTKVPYRSKTLEFMSTYDYIGKSVTGISTVKQSLKTLQNDLWAYGTLYGTGMPYEEYKEAMGYEWEDATQYDKKPVKISVDINQTMNYNTYVGILKKLSRYDGVYLYKIGETTEGRDLYAIEIDMASDYDKNVYMLTGQIHAREFAGGTYIVKQFVDLVQKAQTDKKTMELLKRNKFVAVPIVNIDGREAIINSASKWTTSGGGLWKAYTNGTDGGRNFPGLQWGEVAKGSYVKWSIAKKPGYANYPGAYAGSNSETKAMMKWLYHYTVVEQASFYLDLHQQGTIIYAGKPWQTKSQMQYSLDLRTGVMSILNNNSYKRKYSRVYEGQYYGLQGEGTSLTDYAVGLAAGAKFSPAYGFSAFTDGKKEYILMQIRDLDRTSLKIKTANKSFAAITVEIGYGVKYLGNSAATRSLLANEYKNYNFGKLLESLPKMAN